MFGFNPYALLGGLGLIIAATTGAFFEGKHVAEGEAATQTSKDLAKAIQDGQAKQHRIDELEGERTAWENIRQSAVREIYHDTSKIIERPIYQNECIDADGVKLLDRAQSVASGHNPTDPGAPVSPPAGSTQGPANH